MNQTLSIIDTHDMIDADAVQRFALNRDMSDIRSYTAGIRQAMLDESRANISRPATIDESNYLPGSSLRGDAGCSHWNCRLPKLRRLARYVALYCDHVLIPVKIPRIAEQCDHTDELLSRLDVISMTLGIMELRPLLEAGLATLVPQELLLCKEHWREAVPDFDKILRIAKSLARSNSGRFEVTYYPPKRPLEPSRLSYEGPEEYLEHGKILRVLGSVPEWLSDLNATRPLKLSKRTIQMHKLVLDIFMQMANDAMLQSYFGTAFNARYVTESIAEADFFKRLYRTDALANRTAALCAHLTHTVPLMSEIPLETILKVRKVDPESFNSYRSTITQIVKQYASKENSVGEKEAREIYLDILKPQLDGLEVQAKNLRRTQLKSGILKTTASSLLVALGIYKGILPMQLADLVKTIGGFSVAKDLAETVGGIERNPREIRNHNLYFLLRLKEEARK